MIFLGGILSTMNELYFVLQVIVFSYLMFWIYITFREAQLLMGLATVASAYVIFIHGLSVTLLATFFLLFVVMGTHLQMFIQFGVMPLLGYQHAGDKFAKIGGEGGGAQMAQIQQAVESGQITMEEARQMAQQAQGQEAERGSMRRVLG